MKMLSRLVLLVAGLSVISIPRAVSADRHGSRILSTTDRTALLVATHLAGVNPTRAASWLRSRSIVRSVTLGPDGRSILIGFRDGVNTEILPRMRRVTSTTSIRTPRIRERMLYQAGANTGRALVLEPFADQLGLGPDAGRPEIDALTQAGFRVDVRRNGEVTPDVMLHLSDYSYVYMETHSDPYGSGDVVIALPTTDNHKYVSFLQDGTMTQVTIAGDDHNLYLAVISSFFARHVGTFPSSSIVFINGCGVLPAPVFWNTLQAHNVSTLVGWDNHVYVYEIAAQFLFSGFAEGKSVAMRIAEAVKQGYGTDPFTGAKLTFAGDGTNTLSRSLVGATPIPSTATTSPTPSPTETPTPTPTATSIPKAAKKKRAACRKGHQRVHGKCRPCAKHGCKKPKHP